MSSAGASCSPKQTVNPTSEADVARMRSSQSGEHSPWYAESLDKREMGSCLTAGSCPSDVELEGAAGASDVLTLAHDLGRFRALGSASSVITPSDFEL